MDCGPFNSIGLSYYHNAQSWHGRQAKNEKKKKKKKKKKTGGKVSLPFASKGMCMPIFFCNLELIELTSLNNLDLSSLRHLRGWYTRIQANFSLIERPAKNRPGIDCIRK